MKIVPRNWRDFQHYKDRSPPWIRLHRRLLDNKDFHRLPIASRALAPMLWLLASESVEGQIDATTDDLAFRLRCSEKEIAAGLKPLIEKGFFDVLQDASKPLADRLQSAVPETETETEAETEAETEEPTALVDRGSVNAYRVPACPYEAIAAAYAEQLPQLPQLAVLSDLRKRSLQARWREVCASEKFTQAEGIEYFRNYFAHCAKSAFLTGNGSPGRDGRVWRASFDWLLSPSNFLKVIEGRYHHGRKQA